MTPIDTAELDRLLNAAARHRTNVAQFLEAVCDRGHVTQDEFDAAHSDDEFAQDELRSMAEGLAREVLARRKAEAWQPIETAPKDGSDLLVWYDHDADPYHDPVNPKQLTDYAAWADGGDFLDGKGVCIAKWLPMHWESIGDYGEGYWLPAAFFASENSDYEFVVNAIYWRPLPAPPTTPEAEGGCDERA